MDIASRRAVDAQISKRQKKERSNYFKIIIILLIFTIYQFKKKNNLEIKLE